jgi:hypothetical protein
MQHFGPDKFRDKENQLYEMLQGYGEGAAWYEWPLPCPTEAIAFVREQFERYKVPLYPEIEEILSYGPLLIMDYVNQVDPYALFFEFSDIECTQDWYNYTYEVLDKNGVVSELNPERLDTFLYVHGQAEKFFEAYINNPGFNQLPQFLCASIMDVHTDVLKDDYLLQMYSWHGRDGETDVIDLYHRLKNRCKMPNGEVNLKWANAYFDLTMWAGVLWLFGPLSRGFRQEHNGITEAALESMGEVLLYEGTIYRTGQFRKVARQPKSCYRCGTSAWCVEETVDDDGAIRVICESCATAGGASYDGATCGTKFCRYWDCPNNLYHYDDKAARMGAMRKHGQLGKKAQQYREERVAVAATEQQLAIGG